MIDENVAKKNARNVCWTVSNFNKSETVFSACVHACIPFVGWTWMRQGKADSRLLCEIKVLPYWRAPNKWMPSHKTPKQRTIFINVEKSDMENKAAHPPYICMQRTETINSHKQTHNKYPSCHRTHNQFSISLYVDLFRFVEMCCTRKSIERWRWR